MPITACNEKGEGRAGSKEYQGNRVIIKSTRVFEVHVDDPTHDDQYILDNGLLASPDPLPAILSVHPTNSSLRCKSTPTRQQPGEGKAANCWLVTCEYDNQTSDADATDSETAPLDRRTKWHLEFASFTRILDRDIDGNPILNTVGDVFDPPLEEEDERPVLVAQKNYDAENLPGLASLIVDYRGAVSTDTFLGLPAGSWRIGKVQMSQEQVEDEVRFHTVSWYLEAKEEYDIADPSTVEGTPEPWDRLVLNMGYKAFKTADDSNTKYALVDREPRKLKEDGTLFAHDDDPNYFYRVFKTKKRRPFSALGFV